MGRIISSIPDMVSYAGDLRRAAQRAPTPEVSDKIRQSASTLEKTAFARAGLTQPGIGKLLDKFV